MSLTFLDERISRLRFLASRLEFLKDNHRFRYLAFAFATIIFGVGLYVASRNSDLRWSSVRWETIVWLASLWIPVTVVFNTLEMKLSARIAGCRFETRKAITLTIYASAANMLPLPGAAMVRMVGLKSEGVSIGNSGATTLAIGIVWIGVAFAFSGLFLLAVSSYVGVIFEALGMITLAVSLYWIRRISGSWSKGVLTALLKCLMVLTGVCRMLLSLNAIGVHPEFSQVSVFAVSNVIGSAVSIVPAGLGVRELVSATLAPLGGIQMGDAFLATALDRTVEMTVLLVLAATLWGFSRKIGGSSSCDQISD